MAYEDIYKGLTEEERTDDKRNHFIEKYKMKEKAGLVIAIIAIYGCMHFLGITCPIKYLTGISCPGCGMTRAWIAFFHFDVAKAWNYHPLFYLPPFVVLAVVFRRKMNKVIYDILIFTFIIIFVIVYIIRIKSGNNNIVVFSPRDGLIFRLFNSLFT